MQMSDAEILSSYHGAKDPEKQIGVLADLNAVKSDDMRQYLHKLGAPVELPKEKPHKVRKPPVPNFDVSRALELHAEGLSDLDIAEQLGVKVTNFAAWRRGQGIPANIHRVKKLGKKEPRAQPGQAQAVPDTSGTMTAGRLAEVFARIAKWHPDAPVTMDGKGVAAVMLSSVFDNASDAEVQVFLMDV